MNQVNLYTMIKNIMICCLLLVGQLSDACEESSATFLAGTDNGDGTFTYQIEFCSQFNGTSANPTEVLLDFSFFDGNIQSFEPQTISTNDGSDFVGTIEGTSIRYVFAGGTSSHSENLWCQTITMTSTSAVTMAIVDTNVSEDSPDCEHDLELCPTPSLQAAMACETDGMIDLTALQDGAFPNGTWSGVGVSGSSFDPIAGTQTLTFTAAGACMASAMTTVVVTAVQAPSLQIAGICEADGLFDLTTLGDPAFPNGTWTGTGVNGNEFDPSVGSQNLMFTPFGDCTEPGGTTIFVEMQVIPNLDIFVPLCEQDAPINLPSEQDGIFGIWSGAGVTGNQFAPSESGTGIITLTFTPDVGQCAGSNTTTITVEEGIPATLNDFSPICIDANPINLFTTQNGVTGNWTGNGVSNNTFHPNGLEGINDLTFTPDGGQCAETATTTIEVTTEAITYQLDGLGPVCEIGDPVGLPIFQNGIIGTWSGTGIEDNFFNPSGLSGIVTVTFTPNAGQCGAEAMTTTIVVEESISPVLDAFGPFCELDFVPLPTSQDGIIGNWSGNGVINNVLEPIGQFGGIDLTFTPDSGQCASPASTFIDINAAIAPALDAFSPVCESGNPINLPSTQDGLIGFWSGPGIFANTFDPTGLAGIVTLIFIPDDGECAEEGITTIEVIEGVAISLDNLGNFCNTDAPTNLPLVQDGIQGIWSGIGVTNNTFEPSGLSGNIILTFIPDVIEDCQAETTTMVTVNEAPFAVLSETNLITCNEATQGAILDFSSLIIDGDVSGTWMDSDGAGVDLSDASQVDFDGVIENFTYTFIYTTNSATAPCSEQSYELEVFVEICECPSVATIAPPNICNLNGIIDLSTLEATSELGTWAITETPVGSNPATITGVIFDANGADAGDYEVEFTLDNPTANCPLFSTQIITVDEGTAPTLDALSDMCSDDAPINLPLFQGGVTGNWSGDGVNNNEFNPVGINGLVTLTFTPDAGQCAIENTISFTINDPVTISDINTTCNGDNTFYTVTFEMSGDNPETYTITGGTGSVSGNTFTSDPITSAENYNFDIIANGCQPINVNGTRDCGCSTYAGAMDINPLTFCDYETVVATHDNNENLEGDDILKFVLHTNNGIDLGTVINIYDSPTFTYNEGLMDRGVTYYFSAIAANNLNGSGAIDFADECLSLTQGTPITFRAQNDGCYVLQGQLVEDENSNCLSDMGETGLANWMIKAIGDEIYYTLTEEDGSFSFNVPAGSYEVLVIALNPLWDLCQTSVMTTANSPALADNLEFQAIQNIECPELSVDIGTAFLRRCFSVPYTVRYYNWGTEDATDASINVTLPSLLSISDSTIPVSEQNGNTYTFDIGDVPIGACETFKIFVYTSCEAVFNQTLCVEAEIFPHDYCLPVDPLWSGASLEVESSCEDDLVTFKIKNVGDDMNEPSHYIVVEDAVMLFSTPAEVELGAGEEQSIPFTADGSTYTLLVDQVPFHPERTVPVGVVEACGMNISGEFSTGFVSQFTEGDEEDYLSIDCQQVIGAYDPNDKIGYPMGYGEDFLIEKGQDLEYRIRFQNTGTDTAFTVVIKDEISPFLNIETLQSGTSSHDYDLKIQADTLIFTFSNIMLPDSNVNEPASHGFVKFKINQAPNLELGTLIENEAAIFFDFNEPVITNLTQHRLGERVIQVSVEDIEGIENRIKVYPNPFDESATFEIAHAPNEDLTFELFDVTGRIIRKDIYKGSTYNFYKKDLGQGLYIFKISKAEKVIGTGRVVVQ